MREHALKHIETIPIKKRISTELFIDRMVATIM